MTALLRRAPLVEACGFVLFPIVSVPRCAAGSIARASNLFVPYGAFAKINLLGICRLAIIQELRWQGT